MILTVAEAEKFDHPMAFLVRTAIDMFEPRTREAAAVLHSHHLGPQHRHVCQPFPDALVVLQP